MIRVTGERGLTLLWKVVGQGGSHKGAFVNWLREASCSPLTSSLGATYYLLLLPLHEAGLLQAASLVSSQ